MQFSTITLPLLALLATTALAAPAPVPSDVAPIAGDAVAAEPYFEEGSSLDIVDGPPPPGTVVGVPESKREVVPAEAGHLQARFFFGCPFNQIKCHKHCRSIGGGRKGGYCGNFLKRTCICYR